MKRGGDLTVPMDEAVVEVCKTEKPLKISTVLGHRPLQDRFDLIKVRPDPAPFQDETQEGDGCLVKLTLFSLNKKSIFQETLED